MRIGLGRPCQSSQCAVEKRSGKRGDAFSQFLVGLAYENGNGVPRDYTTALTWYRRAAAGGLAEGQRAVGVMYNFGLGRTILAVILAFRPGLLRRPKDGRPRRG